ATIISEERTIVWSSGTGNPVNGSRLGSGFVVGGLVLVIPRTATTCVFTVLESTGSTVSEVTVPKLVTVSGGMPPLASGVGRLIVTWNVSVTTSPCAMLPICHVTTPAASVPLQPVEQLADAGT